MSDASPRLKKCTPVLVVEAIEPCLAFWTGALGLTVVNEVSDEGTGRLAFVILAGPFELMYQTASSVAKDAGEGLAQAAGKTHLYVEVESLAPIQAALAGHSLFLPERTTFYGSREIGFREPGGHFVTFAAFPGGPVTT